MLSDVCAEAVAHGVVSCVVIDATTGNALASIDRGGVDKAGALLQLLLGGAVGKDQRDEASVREAREVLVVGDERAVFACLTGVTRYFVLLVAPTSLSVALGWSLLRRIVAAAEVSA